MKTIREKLRDGELVVSFGAYDPLSAMAAKKAGATSVMIPGWSVGAALGVTEPLTTLTEFVDITRKIYHATHMAITVDAGAGFGDGPMVKRCVRLFEEAGAQGIHLEDQVFPKRLDYHQGKHFIITVDEMLRKLDTALKSRSSDNFAIIARCDAGRNEGETIQNAIDRANIYTKSGVDAIKVFSRNEEEMIDAPKKIDFPLWYVASEGLGRPIPSPSEAKAMGYAAISYPQTAILAAYSGYSQAISNIINTGRSQIPAERAKKIANEIMDLLSIDELATLETQMKTGYEKN